MKKILYLLIGLFLFIPFNNIIAEATVTKHTNIVATKGFTPEMISGISTFSIITAVNNKLTTDFIPFLPQIKITESINIPISAYR